MLLMHLSDLHFRRGEAGGPFDPHRFVRSEILRDAISQCNALGPPSAILVSGDVAFSGHPEEYEFAASWLDELCAAVGCAISSVFVCPGNHDVDRHAASSKMVEVLHNALKDTGGLAFEPTLTGWLTDDSTARVLYQPLANFNAFAAQYLCSLVPPDNTTAKLDLTLNDGSKLLLRALNSAVISSRSDQKGSLYVDAAAKQLERVPGAEYLIMCHHPSSWIRGGDDLQAHLNDVARIQLFGHEHTNRIFEGRDWMTIAASAAHPQRTEPGWEPGYNLLDLSVEGSGASRYLDVKVHVRVWQQSPSLFRPKVDRRGNTVWHQRFELEPWSVSVATDLPSGQLNLVSPEPVEPVAGKTEASQSANAISMNLTLRDVSVRFFRLRLSQQSAVVGKLDLLHDEDRGLPDFDRFTRALLRAKEQGIVDQVAREIDHVTGSQAQEVDTSDG